MLGARLRAACWPIFCHINGITGRPDTECAVSHRHFHLTEKLRSRFPAGGSWIQSLSPEVTEVTSLEVPTPSCVSPDSSPVTPLLTEPSVTSWQAVWLVVISRLCWTFSVHTVPAVQ